MKQCIKTITWKFKDIIETNPEIKDRHVKLTVPLKLFENFGFLFVDDVKESLV